jgi:predicted Zn-dependent protease
MRAARWICAAVSLLVCAWFALGARQAIDTSRAMAIADRGNTATAAEEREVSSLVHDARALNPDQQPLITLGQVEIEHGDDASAVRVLEPITRSEPQNALAWQTLATAAGDNPALLSKALSHLRVLVP